MTISALMTTAQVCQYLHVTDRTLRLWKDKGMLHPFRINGGKKNLYNPSEVEALLRRANGMYGDVASMNKRAKLLPLVGGQLPRQLTVVLRGGAGLTASDLS